MKSNVKAIGIHTETINKQTKHFVHYKHLNPVLAITHFYLKRSGKNNTKLKNAIGVLQFNIVSKWREQNPDIASSLELFFR